MMSPFFFLLFLGVALLGSLLCSKGANAIRSPSIVGYIAAGALLGPDVLGMITEKQIDSLHLINTLALSFIGFGIGGELRIRELRKLGKTIIAVVSLEATAAFVIVGAVTALLLDSLPLGMIYGALASATAPAGTVEVIREYRAKGDLTTTLYAVMGLDDIYALLLYSLAAPAAILLIQGGGAGVETSIAGAVGHAGLEIGASIGIGAIVGILLAVVVSRINESGNVLLFTLGMLFVNCGLSEYFELSPILLNMATGIIAVNMRTSAARKMIESIQNWAPPLYVWFFVLVGTHLDIALLQQYWLIVVLYIIARSAGKWGGAYLGGRLAGAPSATCRYLGLALFSQAGVAIALAYNASKSLQRAGLDMHANQVLSVITATTFIVMLIGPLFAKTALVRAGEAQDRS